MENIKCLFCNSIIHKIKEEQESEVKNVKLKNDDKLTLSSTINIKSWTKLLDLPEDSNEKLEKLLENKIKDEELSCVKCQQLILKGENIFNQIKSLEKELEKLKIRFKNILGQSVDLNEENKVFCEEKDEARKIIIQELSYFTNKDDFKIEIKYPINEDDDDTDYDAPNEKDEDEDEDYDDNENVLVPDLPDDDGGNKERDDDYIPTGESSGDSDSDFEDENNNGKEDDDDSDNMSLPLIQSLENDILNNDGDPPEKKRRMLRRDNSNKADDDKKVTKRQRRTKDIAAGEFENNRRQYSFPLPEVSKSIWSNCKICRKKFIDRTAYFGHNFTHHSGPKYFNCENCDEILGTFPKFMTHEKKVHGTKFTCKLCPKVFHTESKLKSHFKNEHFKFECKFPGCEKSYKKRIDWQMHEEEHKNISFFCKNCGQEFRSQLRLKNHNKNIHENKKFKCKICDFSSSYKNSYENHILTHTDKFAFNCDICHRKFRVKHRLFKHIKTNHMEKNLKCEKCFKSFPECDIHRFKRHLATHLNPEDRPHKCETCGKSFTVRKALISHQSLHTGVRDFLCDLCPSNFTCQSNLNSHIYHIHTKEKKVKVKKEKKIKEKRIKAEKKKKVEK